MSESEDSEISNAGVHSAGVSVSRDTGTKVDLILRVGGLQKRRSFFASLVSAFKKPSDPSKMCSNATFTTFKLTSSSLQFSIDVQTDPRKKRKGNANRVDTYTCFIRKFPSNVNPDSAEFEIMEPASGNCFILLSLIKIDNLATNWKEFQDTNGTIDVSSL
uniref:C2 NT-type domain-containing protein n=1 Tax=Elaeophora elaphi TaxID=1147741 RepID=A0A0R3S6C4_9BILA